MSHTPHSLQCYLQVPANPNKKDVLHLLLVGCRDGFTHTCRSPLRSQKSYRGHSTLKMSQGDYTTPSPGIRAQQARRECGKGPRELSLLQQFKFQLRCLLTKQTWLFHHSNVSGTSNSFSHSFSSLFSPLILYPLPEIPPPHHVVLFVWKKIFFSELLLAKCDINSFLFSDVQRELALPKRLLILKQDY